MKSIADALDLQERNRATLELAALIRENPEVLRELGYDPDTAGAVVALGNQKVLGFGPDDVTLWEKYPLRGGSVVVCVPLSKTTTAEESVVAEPEEARQGKRRPRSNPDKEGRVKKKARRSDPVFAKDVDLER